MMLETTRERKLKWREKKSKGVDASTQHVNASTRGRWKDNATYTDGASNANSHQWRKQRRRKHTRTTHTDDASLRDESQMTQVYGQREHTRTMEHTQAARAMTAPKY